MDFDFYVIYACLAIIGICSGAIFVFSDIYKDNLLFDLKDLLNEKNKHEQDKLIDSFKEKIGSNFKFFRHLGFIFFVCIVILIIIMKSKL